jgi:hypothetical protein
MKFELRFANMEQRPTMHAKTWRELFSETNLETTDLVSITFVEPAERTFDVKSVNSAWYDYGKRYWNGEAIRNAMADSLRVHHFDVPEDWDSAFTSAVGEMRAVPVGRNTFMCVTWYKMKSGNFEVVAYLS